MSHLIILSILLALCQVVQLHRGVDPKEEDLVEAAASCKVAIVKEKQAKQAKETKETKCSKNDLLLRTEGGIWRNTSP